MTRVNIIVGDALTELRKLPESSVDCIVTDPPYGVTSLPWDKWVDEWPSECLRLLKPSGSMWVFGSMRVFLERIGAFAGWHFVQDMVWEKQNGTGVANDRFRRVHELALQFHPNSQKWKEIYRDTQYTNDATARVVRRKARPPHWGGIGSTVFRSEDGGPRLMRSVIYSRNEHGTALHPTQKPVPILQPLIRYSCPPGGVVLDPFAGAGSTGLAAKIEGRDAVLIEISEEYAEMARQRIRDDAPLFAVVD